MPDLQWDAIRHRGGLARLTAGAYLTCRKRTLYWSTAPSLAAPRMCSAARTCGSSTSACTTWATSAGRAAPGTVARLGLQDRIEFLPMDPDGFET